MRPRPTPLPAQRQPDAAVRLERPTRPRRRDGDLHRRRDLHEGGSPSAPTYRFQPTDDRRRPRQRRRPGDVREHPDRRPDEALINEDGDADLKVASFNVLNYFTTLGDPRRQLGDAAAPVQRPRRRRQHRQRRLRPARRLGPAGLRPPAGQDRHGDQRPRRRRGRPDGDRELRGPRRDAGRGDQHLVAALNADAGAGTWAANPSSADLPPAAGMDVITNAIIYKPAAVDRRRRVPCARHQSSDAGDGVRQRARAARARSFEPTAGGDAVPVRRQPLQVQGLGRSAPGRRRHRRRPGCVQRLPRAAGAALRDWVADRAGRDGGESVVLAGDFNSYAEEDPLQVLYDAGYTDVEQHFANGEYSYSFSGLSGSLDHVLATTPRSSGRPAPTSGTSTARVRWRWSTAAGTTTRPTSTTPVRTAPPTTTRSCSGCSARLKAKPPVKAKVKPKKVKVDKTRRASSCEWPRRDTRRPARSASSWQAETYRVRLDDGRAIVRLKAFPSPVSTVPRCATAATSAPSRLSPRSASRSSGADRASLSSSTTRPRRSLRGAAGRPPSAVIPALVGTGHS